MKSRLRTGAASAGLGGLLGWLVCSGAAAQEIRGLWVDTFHPGLRTREEVHRLVADARAGQINTLFVEVRRRGDAFYESRYEPKAHDLDPPSFDPLAELITLARDSAAGPRIEVHAWIVTYNIWNQFESQPRQPDHPYRLHPDWLTRSMAGGAWDGANFAFDPAHPEVQRHTFNVAMDLVTRYDIDGLQLDYIRYEGLQWGYNPRAVARFQRLFRRSDVPLPEDPEWTRFRRDQVTALVRKVYLSAIALKPAMKISAATITWAPGITRGSEWPSSSAYAYVLQDWRGWMEEGILDLNVPMVYFKGHTANARDWAAWSAFAKNHRYNRQVAIGAALYLNTPSRSLEQVLSTRQATGSGARADGVVMFSYASQGLERTEKFLPRLTRAAAGPGPGPVFAGFVAPPEMPWKQAPTRGHLMGYVRGPTGLVLADGATVLVSGIENRRLVTDATGFYGTVDLPPGSYTITGQFERGLIPPARIEILAGEVNRRDLQITIPEFEPAAGSSR